MKGDCIGNWEMNLDKRDKELITKRRALNNDETILAVNPTGETDPAVKPTLSSSQFNALHAFYNDSNGEYWIWRKDNNITNSIPWNFSIPEVNPCLDRWQGIGCHCELTTCDITQIVLDHHNVSGILSDSIGELIYLETFILRANNISGSIPNQIQSLVKLVYLDLSFNQFDGAALPKSIDQLFSLQYLNLQYNYLTTIPNEIYNLTNLIEVDFQFNLIAAKIPSMIHNWQNLENLDFSYNHFISSIPVSLGSLKKLKTLNIGDNSLTGKVPEEIFQLTNLTTLVLASNQLEGTLSNNIGNLTQLLVLDLSINHFYSSIPFHFCHLEKLTTFIAEKNLFSQQLPSCMSMNKNLKAVIIEKNGFTNSLQSSLLQVNLTLVGIGNNFFHGPLNNQLPDSSWGQIIYLNIENNTFSGLLPLMNNNSNSWKDLLIYEVNENYFEGNLTGLNSMFLDQLFYLVLEDNYLTNSIPNDFLLNSTHLYFFSLGVNLITGTIPTSLSQFPNLNQLILKSNFLTSTLPSELIQLKLLAVLDVSTNRLTGSIPNNLIDEMIFLHELFLQDNSFTGDISKFLTWNHTHENISCLINTIDFSSNQFTGSLPADFLRNTLSMQSFTASINCLYGSIPTEFCEMKSLVSIGLDGLTTSNNCRKYFFPQSSSSYLNGFTVDHFMTGTVPACLFDLPAVQSIHLSGNGLTGTLPDSIVFPSTLRNLYLSYNLLTGTIPLGFQNAIEELDLSDNRLSGTLSSEFLVLPNSTLTLDVNRLSGIIPASVLDMANVNILNGNLFYCEPITKTGLPAADPNYETYSCGSNSVNATMLVWVLIFPLTLTCMLWSARITSKRSSINSNHLQSLCPDFLTRFQEIWQIIQIWRSTLRNSKSIEIARLSLYFQSLRRACLEITLFIIFILLPLYCFLSLDYSNYSQKYIWFGSGLLNHGHVPGIVLTVTLIFFISVVASRFEHISKIINLRLPFPSRPGGSTEKTKMDDGSTSREIEKKFSVISPSAWETIPIYLLILLNNLILVCAVDFSYIYLILNYNSTEVILAAFGLALFRLFNNNFLLWVSLPWGRRLLLSWKDYYHRAIGNGEQRDSQTDRSVDENATMNVKDLFLQFTSNDISFLERVSLFNNIIIPVIATIFILPDCFYNLLFTSSSVTSTYLYFTCYQYILIAGSPEKNCITYMEGTTYIPPFVYSYQCSSKIIINYVVVYLLMFILVGLLIPLMKILIKVRYETISAELNRLIETVTLTLDENSRGRMKVLKIRKQFFEKYLLIEPFKPLSPSNTLPSDSEQEGSQPGSFTEEAYQPNEAQQESFADSSTTVNGEKTESSNQSKTNLVNGDNQWTRFTISRLTLSLFQRRRKRKSPKKIVFNKLQFTVQFHSYFAVLLTFGALFPPLAVICCSSIWLYIYFEELVLGRLLYESSLQGFDWYEKKIAQESEHIEQSNHTTLWSILLVSSCVFAFILLDTIGDINGWQTALPVMIVMVLFPIFLFFIFKVGKKCLGDGDEEAHLKINPPNDPEAAPQSVLNPPPLSNVAERTKSQQSRVFSDELEHDNPHRLRLSEIQMVSTADTVSPLAHLHDESLQN